MLAVVVLVVAGVLALSLRGKLRADARRGELPGQDNERRREHVAVGPDEQLDGDARGVRSAAWHLTPSGGRS
ncbi:MAG: hypothetical protein M3161_07595 [Actinomycetota bacterium]|nr:hypothetical protein [Actinomycetota bacterium]